VVDICFPPGLHMDRGGPNSHFLEVKLLFISYINIIHANCGKKGFNKVVALFARELSGLPVWYVPLDPLVMI